MIIAVFTILISGYVLCVFVCTRRFLSQAHETQENKINDMKNALHTLEQEKEGLYSEKINLQNEASNIFTLYEITKDIANVLHEKEAFKVFEAKLKGHLHFIDCQLIKPDQEDISIYEQNGDYFVLSLKIQEKNIGYLVLKGISEQEKDKTTILATQFLLALRRVTLYQEIERVAITDSLTDVYTRRHTFERLNEEINRSKAQHLNLAVLMVDVDHFKNINDTHGHLTGDQVLREIARIIKENLREIDIAGRYGGEEFCIVLPDTNKEGAQFAAERIRQATASGAIKAYDNVIHATVSIGLCQFPKDGQRSTELIDKADWALYRAKKLGRNRICAFGIYDDQN